MRRTGLTVRGFGLGTIGLCWAVAAAGEPLTVERAVQLALKQNSQVIGAQAGVLDARGGLYGAYAGVIPMLSASLTQVESKTTGQSGKTLIAGQVFPVDEDSRFTSTTPTLSASWSGLRLSSWAGLSSARQGLKASHLRLSAARNDVALSARQQFYEVVKAIKLADVAEGAVKLARDDQRRVRALFEVGSVSKSDLLKAQVRTAQSELDNLTARHNIVSQRNLLAGLLGLREAELGDVDTVLTVVPSSYEEAEILAEAGKNRPDLIAAEAELGAARAGHTSARLARLPYVTAGGSLELGAKSEFTQDDRVSGLTRSGDDRSDRQLSAQVALRWDLFDGLATDARIASARARLERARNASGVLQRNLANEVHEAMLAHREAVERDSVARKALESATESLKLTQEKYNVGSATILELIDAQVQLQRAQSDGVSALAAIRVAEAQISRIRGRAE